MIVVQPGQALPPSLRRAVIAIGNFDGAHLGHQVIFEVARKRALDLRAPFVILTFTPHPRRFFAPDSPPFLLTPEALQIERFALSKADGVVVLPFDATFAALSAPDFITTILKGTLDAQHIVIGRDFRFGQARSGDAQTLLDAGIAVTRVDALHDAGGEVYSSTRARAALGAGDLAGAEKILGWTWELRGVVIHGDKRGRTLGYPTANMALGDTVHPAYGVYSAFVRVGEQADAPWQAAAVNIGIRPMFATRGALLEAHLIDFSGDLYGQSLHVRPVAYLRPELKFSDLDGLVRQIEKDVEQAQKILNKQDPATRKLFSFYG